MVHNLLSIKKYTYNTVGLRRISFFSEIRSLRSVTTFLAQTLPPPPTKKCPCGAAPIGLFIKKLHNLNQTPTYQRNDIKKEEINLLIKKLLNMKSRGELAESCAVQAPVGRTKKKRLKNTKLVGWLDSEIIL
jgi:hypothetical protein